MTERYKHTGPRVEVGNCAMCGGPTYSRYGPDGKYLAGHTNYVRPNEYVVFLEAALLAVAAQIERRWEESPYCCLCGQYKGHFDDCPANIMRLSWSVRETPIEASTQELMPFVAAQESAIAKAAEAPTTP